MRPGLLAALLAASCATKAPAGGDATADAIWQPAPGTTWHWQLSGTVDTGRDVAVYDIDLFEVPDAQIHALHAAGRQVICYFSAGTVEGWRADADAFPDEAVGAALPDWDGERWLDVRSDAVRSALVARLDHARVRGCDAVEPDNVDAWENVSGFPLTSADQSDFLRFLATEAHARGLSIGLKNALPLVPELVTSFDWALNEECVAQAECEALRPFIEAGKAVFHAEYADDPAAGAALAQTVCADRSRAGFSTLVAGRDLDGWAVACSD